MSDVVSISRQNLVFQEKIGEGGYSTVYRMIWKTELGDKLVAVKRLNKVDDRELKVLSGLRHKHIVHLLGVVDECMDFMLVLELCEGGSIRSYLDKQNNNRLPLLKLFDWAEQAAIAIQYLKEEGIIHKDIKAANYLISKGDILKLADFGVAKHANTTQSNATDRGTYGWMAPELFIDGILSPTFDIYAYGITLWEMITTEIPFKDRERQWVLYHVCHDGLRPKIPQNCPKKLKDLMKRCWHSNRRKRPSISEILVVIRESKDDEIKRGLDVQPCRGESSTDSLRVLRTSVWTYETEFVRNDKQSLANDVAVDKRRSRVLIADGEASTVNVYSMDGRDCLKITLTETKRRSKSKPHQIAIYPIEGTYFVTDGTSVVTEFDANDRVKATFPFTKPDLSCDVPELEGLAIEKEGLLLVGDVSNQHISRHATYEMHKNEGRLKIGIKPHYLAVTPRNEIAVSSYESHEVQIIDQRGSRLRSLQPPTTEVPQWAPYGVTCDESMLYVCNWATDAGRGVHCFGLSNFEYMRCIIYSEGCPRGLEVIDNGKRLVMSIISGFNISVVTGPENICFDQEN